MSTYLEEFHLSGIIISFVIEVEIAAYFLYSYYKIKDEKLGLNKILLAYGLLYAFGFTGVFLRVLSSYYIEEAFLNDIFKIATHFLIVIAALFFQGIVISKPFNEIISNKTTKFVLFLTVIFSILLIIVQDVRIYGFLILSALLIGATYMLFFHYRLIKRSMGNIRKRLILITMGNIIMIIPILIGAKDTAIFIPIQYQEMYLILLVPILIIGLAMIFLGVFQFPAFLEFEWEKSLLNLYIINQQDFYILYSFDFSNLLNIKKNAKFPIQESTGNELIFSGGFKGINDIITIVTDTKEKKINKIKQGNSIFLLDYSESFNLPLITFLLIVNKEMNSSYYFLQTIKNEFLNYYRDILLNLNAIKGREKEIFSNFDNNLNIILKSH